MTADQGKTITELKAMLSRCVLCPRRCLADRTKGECGFCRLGAGITIASAIAHHGEEPPISGSGGAGTIFFTSCNLQCIYCQNYQISHSPQGEMLDSAALAGIMLLFEAQGCHNIEPVTPTPQMPQIMEALALARKQGLLLPFVYNCGGYEEPAIIQKLAGMVDIYLPDFKYGSAEEGRVFSGAEDYPVYAVAAIREMVRQVGDELEMAGAIARKGVLIRHLVLPGKLENSFAALKLIWESISQKVPLSIMAQYTPIPAVAGHPVLGRRVSRREYEAVVNYALELGFETIFVQEVDDRNVLPDFEREEPFAFS